jgi:hypothetical protein
MITISGCGALDHISMDFFENVLVVFCMYFYCIFIYFMIFIIGAMGLFCMFPGFWWLIQLTYFLVVVTCMISDLLVF